jgi:predicted ester cyclase
MLGELFAELEFDLAEVVSEGDIVAVRYTMRGTARSGRKVDLSGMDFLRLKDGIVEEAWDIFDQSLRMAQLDPGRDAGPSAPP